VYIKESVLARETMDGLGERSEATASTGTRETVLRKIIADSSLPVEAEPDSAGALRRHLDDTRLLRLDDDGRERSNALLLGQDTNHLRANGRTTRNGRRRHRRRMR
jgi:hypothetical protein